MTVALYAQASRTAILIDASERTAAAAFDLEAEFGEGPARTAMSAGRPVAATGAALPARWPGYGRAARRLGVHSVTAVPLQVPATRLGVLCCYGTGSASSGDIATTATVAAALIPILLRAAPANCLPALIEAPHGSWCTRRIRRQVTGSAGVMPEMSAEMACRYRFDEMIAAGGFGEVWRGTDVTLGRTVAIKLLRPACAQDPATLARFRAEARNAAALCHPHIAAIHDFCEPAPPASPFLVMEYVAGPSLAALLADGPIGAAPAMRVLAEAALGLAAAHQAGLVHRDIKPGNLLLDRDGRVKITDFGISHAAGTAPLTATGVLMGTPAYMAPERIAGARGSTASDIYSLGVVAYHAVTGTVPFSGEPLDVAVASRERPLPPLPESVPHQVAAFIMRLTAKDPAARPEYALDVARTAERLCGELTAGPGLFSRRAALIGPGARRRHVAARYPTRRQPEHEASTGPARLYQRAAVAVAAIIVTLAGVYLAANGETAAAPRAADPKAAALLPPGSSSSPPSQAHGPERKASRPPSRARAPQRKADATALAVRIAPIVPHHHGRAPGHEKAHNKKGHGPDGAGDGGNGPGDQSGDS